MGALALAVGAGEALNAYFAIDDDFYSTGSRIEREAVLQNLASPRRPSRIPLAGPHPPAMRRYDMVYIDRDASLLGAIGDILRYIKSSLGSVEW